MPLQIGFDISPVIEKRTGVGNYCYYLLKHLVALGEAEYVGFASGTARIALGPLAASVSQVHAPLPTRALYGLWNVLGFPAVDRLLGGVDVYHATNFYLPPVRQARTALTIHDLAFMALPETCSPKIVGPFSRSIRRFAHRADAILVYSEATRRDVVRFLEAPADKIAIAPMAVDEGFIPMDRDEAVEWVAAHYGIRQPFLLFVSTLEPRKNVPGLLRAFAKVKNQLPHSLVLIGSVGWNADDIFETIAALRIEDRVIRPGFVPHMKLPAFYCAADAFVFPTLYEGFGLPLLEALACGCPVVTADNSSVPEVTGGAALMSAAEDEDAVAANIVRIVSDSALREDLVHRGRAHAQQYSWRACAEKTFAVYRELAG